MDTAAALLAACPAAAYTTPVLRRLLDTIRGVDGALGESRHHAATQRDRVLRLCIDVLADRCTEGICQAHLRTDAEPAGKATEAEVRTSVPVLHV